MLATHDHFQEPKKQRLVTDHYRDGSDFEGDVRFRDYANALHSGDLETCDKLRVKHALDPKFIIRVGTMERMLISEMARYAQEIKILKQERTAYRKLAEGLDSGSKRLIKESEKIFKKTQKARETHEEVMMETKL